MSVRFGLGTPSLKVAELGPMPGLLFSKAHITEHNNNPLCASGVLMGMVLM